MSKKTKNKNQLELKDMSFKQVFDIREKVQKNFPEVKGAIILPANQFAEYQRLSSEIAANERARKAIKEQWEKAGLFPIASKASEGQYVIVNGNGDEQGKATVYHFSGAVIPASYRLKIS